MNRKICVVTGSRAEYDLLRWVMHAIKTDSDLSLQLVVTGMHLSPEFGLTYKLIEQDGFCIDRKVETLLSSDTAVGIAKSIGLGLMGFADVLNDLKPDLVLLLGDRFEIFSVACAALVAKIPIVHLHGGETTEGAFDEALRHSITKMSHIHCVANEIYRNRVIQLGENPSKVFNVGGLGVDSISKLSLLSRAALESELDLKFGLKNLLISFHPVTMEMASSIDQLQELLAALSELQDTTLIFTQPNADTSGRALGKMLENFVASHATAKLYKSLGQLKYLSCVLQVDAVVGNSSSGLLEVPVLKKPTINIGNRQLGRLCADSVINCEPKQASIADAIKNIYSADFSAKLKKFDNPYGSPGASVKIVDILKRQDLKDILRKRFYDDPLRTIKQLTK